jgi:hypothetical protein
VTSRIQAWKRKTSVVISQRKMPSLIDQKVMKAGPKEEVIADKGYHLYALKRDKLIQAKREEDRARHLNASHVLGLANIED